MTYKIVKKKLYRKLAIEHKNNFKVSNYDKIFPDVIF